MKFYIFCTIKLFFCFLWIHICQSVLAQEDSGLKEIRKVLNDQSIAWNDGDMEGYMNGYWKSDSLRFIGKSGINLGWQTTLNQYKKSYPDKKAMGTLRFEILHEYKTGEKNYFMIGKWFLEKENGESVQGYFSLLWERIQGKWVIIADHSN